MAHLSQERIQSLYDEFGELKVLDDIIRHRAADDVQVPILGYPRFEDSVDDYELFTGKQLDRFIDLAIEKLVSSGLKPNGKGTIGLLAPSNLDFIVSFFAISRLGYTILTLSLRITPAAVLNLLQQCNCDIVLHGSSQGILKIVQEITSEFSVKLIKIPRRPEYDNPKSQVPPFIREYNRNEENEKTALILHSSGSTGLPKPVWLSHRAILSHAPQGSGLHNFNALPWYHMYGISTSIQAMWMRKTAHLYNTSLPLTAENLIAVLKAVKPGAIHSVPYALGLLAEKQRGIELMRACQVVTSAGAKTPDELGDRLVKEGVRLGVVFGSTEAGLLGDTMRREVGDDSWNYIRIYANLKKHIYMKPIGDNLYECVYLKGHPALSTSNSDDPFPGSWHSKDVFVPHQCIPDVWKYVTRIDDRVTLITGEKVLPLPIEGRTREDKLVREAVVFGIDRAIPGLLVIRSEMGDEMTDDDYLDAIWPSIADANSRAEAFSQITKDLVIPISSSVDYPQTDKGSVIRAQVYKKFEEQINETYTRFESNQEGSLKLDLPALEAYLIKKFRSVVGVPLKSVETDFFGAGVDSLQAIQMRRVIQKTLELSGRSLSPNVIYESGNVKRLARYLYDLRKGEAVQQEDCSLLMKQLIQKYSRFQEHRHFDGDIKRDGFSDVEKGRFVILTGATGSLGVHTLLQLVESSEIEKVYCLVRGPEPMRRIQNSLRERNLELPEASKVVALTEDLSRSDLGLDSSILEEMRGQVSLIIHIAWPVNFNIHLQSFEPHIGGLHNLLEFSLSVRRPQPAQLFFCSSVSTAFKTPSPATIPEAAIEDFSHASSMGYAQSKLVGEHIVRNAARAGARSYVLRIGQIVGDTRNGIWNDKEFVPLMIRSALTLKMLPDLQENCSWLPVDTTATVILDISRTLALSTACFTKSEGSIFYNLTNPHIFPWGDTLNELRAVGLEFKIVPFGDWLESLRTSAAQEADLGRNPAGKLVEYFEHSYEDASGIVFDTTAAQRISSTLREAPDVIREGYMRKFWTQWSLRWS